MGGGLVKETGLAGTYHGGGLDWKGVRSSGGFPNGANGERNLLPMQET